MLHALSLQQACAPRVALQGSRRISPTFYTPLRTPALPPVTRRVATAVAKSQSIATQQPAVLTELKNLERERDEAVATAEACSKTAVKLEEMAQLLQQLALEKVKSGDEAGARQVLIERASVKEALERSASKADANYTLARKLAARIAECQGQLLESVRPSPSSSSSTSRYTSSQPTYTSTPYRSYPSTSTGPSPSPSSSSSSSSSESSPKWKWEQSLQEARQRLAAQEAQAQAQGLSGRKSAEESISEAQGRIRSQVQQSIAEAQERLRQASAGSQGSLEQAQARLRERDEEVLRYVRRIMTRYRRGEYVSEDELEFAFRQLENRFGLL